MVENSFTIDKDALEITIIGTFNATPEALYQAYTDPLQIPKWWGPDAFTVEVTELDTRIGGSWRFIYATPGQEPFAWSGIYQELDPPRKIVSSFVFEPNPGHVHIGTVLIDDQHNDTTKVTETLKFMHAADLDDMVAQGIQQAQFERQARLANLTEAPQPNLA